jgi:cytochrome c peroxidase
VVKRHLLLACVALLAGCSGTDESGPPPYDGPPIPWAYQPFPKREEPKENPTTDAKVALGQLLFYDPILSSDRAVACATCHSEIWGMSDGLPLSIGVGGEGPTGPGRTGPNLTRRNAQTLWNAGFRKRLFWDGRVASLEEQVLHPLKEPKELGRDVDAVVADLAAIDEYAKLFAAAFGQPAVTADNMTRAIAALERTMVSDRAPYDRYVAGDEGALSSETIRGMKLFGEAGCAGCHVAPLFESERFSDRGVGDGSDLGRYEATQEQSDLYAFRVPTLRNARDSEPYFHDGSVQDLRAAVAQEVQRSVLEGDSRPLADDEIDAISTFIDKALTDTSGGPHRPKKVPSGLQVPVDGFRVPR